MPNASPPSIERLGQPLAFKVRLDSPADGPDVAVRTKVRALEGMQKQALVHYGPTGTVWSLISDEGPYLQGTDLAPFPLAFYTAGFVFSYMEEIRRAARQRGVTVTALEIVAGHYYTMQGSAIRGDMIGGAEPAELKVRLEADAPRATIEEVLGTARDASPAEACNRDVLANTFSITLNGRPVPVADLNPTAGRADDPTAAFDGATPGPACHGAIITKLDAAEAIHGVDGGVGSSLKAEQKRLLHIHSEAKLLKGALKEIKVVLIKPIGSTFRFLSDEGEDDGGGDLAPPALAYLSAGVGFCYMTQIGRYAHITKRPLMGYRIVQDSVFRPGAAEPVETHAFLELDEDEAAARKVVYMGERTCFLHAAMRSANPTELDFGSP